MEIGAPGSLSGSGGDVMQNALCVSGPAQASLGWSKSDTECSHAWSSPGKGWSVMRAEAALWLPWHTLVSAHAVTSKGPGPAIELDQS
jgi:hypothetical protein